MSGAAVGTIVSPTYAAEGDPMAACVVMHGECRMPAEWSWCRCSKAWLSQVQPAAVAGHVLSRVGPIQSEVRRSESGALEQKSVCAQGLLQRVTAACKLACKSCAVEFVHVLAAQSVSHPCQPPLSLSAACVCSAIQPSQDAPREPFQGSLATKTPMCTV